MAKKKITITTKSITRKEFLENFTGKKLKTMKESLKIGDLEAKYNIDAFHGYCHSVPIPVRLLRSRISKQDEYAISQMIAHVVNKEKGTFARTAQFLDKHPAGTAKGDLVRKGIKWTIEGGKEGQAAMDEMWAKPEGYKVGKYEVAWLPTKKTRYKTKKKGKKK